MKKIKKQLKQADIDTLSSKIRSYSALAGSFIAFTPITDAAVVYTDKDPDINIYNHFVWGPYHLDLNNDGIADFYLNWDQVSFVPSYYDRFIKISPANYGAGVEGMNAYPNAKAHALSSNSIIGPKQKFLTANGQIMASIWYWNGIVSGGGGEFLNTTDKYLGLRFQISGQTHYGWARISMGNSINPTYIHDYAYESTPLTPILAGNTGVSPTCMTPGNVSVTNVTSNSVRLNWGTVSGVTGYNIHGRSLGNAFTASIFIDSETTSHLDIGNLPSGVGFEWEVRSVCGTSTSAFSPVDTFYTMDCIPPDPISTSNLTSSSVTLNWTSVINATSYTILGRAVGSSSIASFNITPPATSFNVGNLPSGVSFEWAMISNCGTGGSSQSPYSAVNTFTTLASSEKNENEVQIGATVKGLIFPNPVIDIATVRFHNPDGKSYQMLITDVSGKVIQTHNGITSDHVRIETNNLAAGVYLVELRGDQYFSDKLIVR